jgi:hypothetical protein
MKTGKEVAPAGSNGNGYWLRCSIVLVLVAVVVLEKVSIADGQ